MTAQGCISEHTSKEGVCMQRLLQDTCTRSAAPVVTTGLLGEGTPVL